MEGDYPWVALCQKRKKPLSHPLDGLWTPGFKELDQMDFMDVQLRALRGMIVKHRPVKGGTVTQDEAKRLIAFVHRHTPSLTGWKFGCGLWDPVGLIGVAVVGRPSARLLDDKRSTLEVTRLCLMANAPGNSASMLYGRACRASREMGFSKVVTYTLASEDGTSLRASGFTAVATGEGGEWGRPSRHREEADFDTGPKVRWEKRL